MAIQPFPLASAPELRDGTISVGLAAVVVRRLPTVEGSIVLSLVPARCTPPHEFGLDADEARELAEMLLRAASVVDGHAWGPMPW